VAPLSVSSIATTVHLTVSSIAAAEHRIVSSIASVVHLTVSSIASRWERVRRVGENGGGEVGP
jgi:hypothetical protein